MNDQSFFHAHILFIMPVSCKFLLLRMVLLSLLAGQSVWIHAQKPKAPATSMNDINTMVGMDLQELTFCDVLIPRVKSDLQAEANKKCETRETCILCKERNTNQPIYASMFIQPEPAACPSAYVGVSKSQLSASAQSNRPSGADVPFQAEIRQSSCPNGNTSLEVVVMGNVLDCDANRATYTFQWTIDGNKGGHDRTVSCICGNEAEVRIIQPGTGHTVTRKIRLQPCKTNE